MVDPDRQRQPTTVGQEKRAARDPREARLYCFEQAHLIDEVRAFPQRQPPNREMERGSVKAVRTRDSSPLSASSEESSQITNSTPVRSC
jgi:hypothetical protein